jgi:protein-L-isoaspartate(D-aspartate) O-methyltransferase
MNLEDARAQMLGQQLRAWEVLDDRVLAVLREIPRELFVPDAYRQLAFADLDIPLAHGQQMMAPKLEGRLLQALDPDSTDSILEIGTGSGFLTACLSRLAGNVISLDIFADLVRDAKPRLDQLGIDNVELRAEDAMAFSPGQRFDAIAVTGSVPELDNHFIGMLRPGGRLFVIVGREPVMDARMITLHPNGEWTQDSLFETVVPPLLNAERPEPFVL